MGWRTIDAGWAMAGAGGPLAIASFGASTATRAVIQRRREQRMWPWVAAGSPAPPGFPADLVRRIDGYREIPHTDFDSFASALPLMPWNRLTQLRRNG